MSKPSSRIRRLLQTPRLKSNRKMLAFMVKVGLDFIKRGVDYRDEMSQMTISAAKAWRRHPLSQGGTADPARSIPASWGKSLSVG